MRPFTRSRYAIALVWGLFWLLLLCVEVEDYRRDGGSHWWRPILWSLSSMVVVTLLLLVQWRANARDPLPVSSPGRWFLRQAMWLPMYWIIFTPLTFGIRHAVYALNGESYSHSPWPELFVYENLNITLLLILVAAASFGLQSWHEMAQVKLRAEQTQRQLRDAQLAQLTQQMQPHFLFNALNTIGGLMHLDVARADATLTQLAALLRATLALSERTSTTLAEEITLARAYASIMQERFQQRVTLNWEIAPDTLDILVPSLSLQPLLENVFKHTVERQRTPVAIRITTRIDARTLLLEVSDDSGHLGPMAPGGIGVSNLRTRLQALYGAGASLSLTQLAPSGVSVQMRVPCGS